MIYLSKGIVQKGSTEQLLFVLYGGQKFELTGNAAAAWLNGRFKFAEALGRNEPPVAYLQKLGLAETETDNDELSRYRITSRCIFCPADTTESVVLRAMDKEILQWLKNAGVRLTVREIRVIRVFKVSISTQCAGWHFFCFCRFLPVINGMK